MFMEKRKVLNVGDKVCTRTGRPHQNGRYITKILRFTTLPSENRSLKLNGVYLVGCKEPVNSNTVCKCTINVKKAAIKDAFSKY